MLFVPRAWDKTAFGIKKQQSTAAVAPIPEPGDLRGLLHLVGREGILGPNPNSTSVTSYGGRTQKNGNRSLEAVVLSVTSSPAPLTLAGLQFHVEPLCYLYEVERLSAAEDMT